MNVELLIFYFFATMLIASATAVITVRNPVYSAMFLVLSFFSAAILWMLMQAEFLAIVLVLVYVGAVMVLFLFVIMMLDINMAHLRKGFLRVLPIGIIVAVLVASIIIIVVDPENFDMAKYKAVLYAADYNNTAELGNLLYTTYVLQFELAAVILLVAIIAAIALTLRRRENTLHQNPPDQIAVKRDDRIRMVNMKSEQRK